MGLVTSAAVAAMMIGTPSAEQQFFEDQPSPKELLAQLRSEPQDPEWTHIAEQEIRAHYETVSHFRVDKVVCATSICEIMGDVTSKNEAEMNKTSLQLQQTPFLDELRNKGYKNAMAGFGPNGYFAFWLRDIPTK